MNNRLATIRDVILEVAGRYGVEVERIILFGSRARGDSREDSDWDILIVTREDYDRGVVRRFTHGIDLCLVEVLRQPVDVVVVSKGYFEARKEWRGFVYYWAAREGVEIK